MEYNEYGFPINYNSGYGLGTGSNNFGTLPQIGSTNSIESGAMKLGEGMADYQKTVNGVPFGASTTTPNSGAFQGVYKGILSDTGEMGWSTDPAAFKAGTVEDAVWGDGKTLNAGGAMAPDDSLLGLSTGEWENAMKAGQLGMGAGQLGLGIAGYFQNRGLADKQKELYGQQIESNRAEIDSRKNYRNALGSFGK